MLLYTRRTRLLAGLTVGAALIAAGCDRPLPQPTLTGLKFTRNHDHKGYTITGLLHLPGTVGFYSTDLDATYGDGCRLADESLDLEYARNSAAADKTISHQLKTPRQVATASVRIHYSADAKDPSQDVFYGEKVVDPALHPPQIPKKPCQAPLTAAQRLEQLPREQQVALAINSAGFPCARVTDLYPDSAGQIIAHCTKYRSGRGRVTYRIDADGGTVDQVE